MGHEGGPRVGEETIRFAVPDPDRDLVAVRLHQELLRPRAGPDFLRLPEDGGWVLHFPRVDILRMEYKIEIVAPDGSSEVVYDPWNPNRVATVFGDKSVIELPGYSPPEWLRAEVPHGTVTDIELKSRAARARVRALVWSSASSTAGEALPLLVAHDGPEYAELAGLTRFLDVCVAEGRVPPMRAVLLAPAADRNETYSASAAYSRALAHEILPRVTELFPTPHGRSMRVAMGASLGALAMLHVHRRHPATFGALYLQSGSFFRQRYDRQESSFPRFRRIARFMGQVLSAEDWPQPVPVTITCGTVEENLANNRATNDALVRQGYDVAFATHSDAHNYTSWRDTFDPHLVDLLAKVWG